MAEDTRANYAQVLGALCGPSQEPLGKGGTVSVQKHLSTGLPPHYTKKKKNFFTYLIVNNSSLHIFHFKKML